MIRALIVAVVPLLPGSIRSQTYTPLFNGTSLAGWTTQGQGTWEVRGGAIHGSGAASNPKNSWLISEKATYRDFDFRAASRFPNPGPLQGHGLEPGGAEGAGQACGSVLNGTRVVNHDLTRVESQGFFAVQIHDKQVSRISLKDLAIAEVSTAIQPRGRARAGLSEPAGVPTLTTRDLAGRQLPSEPSAEVLRYFR